MAQLYRHALRVTIIVHCLLLTLASGLAGQPLHVPWEYGITLHSGLNMHSAGIGSLPGFERSPDAPPYQSGNGTAFGFGISLAYHPNEQWSVGVGLGLRSLAGAMDSEETVEILDNRDPENPTFVTGVFTHTLDASVLAASMHPRLSWRGLYPFVLSGGLELALPLSDELTQSQVFTSPLGSADFEDPPDQVGSIPDISGLTAFLTATLAWETALNESLNLRPEISYRRGLNAIVNGEDWSVHTLSAGVTLTFRPTAEKPVLIDTLYRRDTTLRIMAGLPAETLVRLRRVESTETDEEPRAVRRRVIISESYERQVPKPAAFLNAGIRARFVLDGAEAAAVDNLPLETVLVQNTIPLIPWLVFGDGSPALANRYLREHAAGSSGLRERLHNELPDTLARRLQAHAAARLSILLSVTADGRATELNDITRKRQRALAAYLHSLGVPQSRLAVISETPQGTNGSYRAGLPDKVPYALLSCAEPAILAPYRLCDTLHVPVSPLVRFRPQVISEAGIATWALGVEQGGNLITTFTGEGDPPEMVDWDMAADSRLWSLSAEPLRYVLRVKDMDGQEFVTPAGDIRFTAPTESDPASSMRRHIQRFDFFPEDVEALAPTSEIIDSARAALRPGSSISLLLPTTQGAPHSAAEKLRAKQRIAHALGVGRGRIRLLRTRESAIPNDAVQQTLARLYTLLIDTPIVP